MCVSLRVLLLSPSITGADAEVVCAESKEQLTTFRALVRAFRVSCTQCDSSVQVQCHMTYHMTCHMKCHVTCHMTQGLLGDTLLKERLDMDTLEAVSLVPSKTNFNQRYVKTKTKLL